MKKFLTVTLFAATLATGALSVQALGTKAQAQMCGQACIVPHASCPNGCFCQINGIDTGICTKR